MATPARAALTGMGVAVPSRVMTNADFEKFLDTSDEWITQRTGIKERHMASEGETTASLAIDAARIALEQAGVKPVDLDLIICATVSPEMPFPATACFVQNALEATNVPAFDISAACSGFIYGLAIADQFIRTGMYKRILVVGVDVLSRFADFEDRRSCILFGDAAGAAVFEPANDSTKGILYNVLHADGSGWDYIHVPAGGTREPTSQETLDQRKHYVKMRGRDVYRFAVEKMQWLLGDCMEKFNFPMEKVYINIDRYGNTSGASIPLAMVEAQQKGLIGPGSTLLLVAFGAGLTWAGSVLRL